jgi:hypothetical protein
MTAAQSFFAEENGRHLLDSSSLSEQAAFNACFIMEVCPAQRKWRFISAPVVIPQRLLHPIAGAAWKLDTLERPA